MIILLKIIVSFIFASLITLISGAVAQDARLDISDIITEIMVTLGFTGFVVGVIVLGFWLITYMWIGA